MRYRFINTGKTKLSNYIISQKGVVRNLTTGKELKGAIHNKGYKSIAFHGERHLVHRLVLFTWGSGYRDGMVANHKDGNKLNNDIRNLEWVTTKENTRHAIKNKIYKKGPKPLMLNPKEAWEVRYLYNFGFPPSMLATAYGRTAESIIDLAKYKTYISEKYLKYETEIKLEGE